MRAMADDWRKRLTDRGYHALPAKREDTNARWDCEVRVKDGKNVGDAIVAYGHAYADNTDASVPELKLKVGDACYMSGSPKGSPTEIGQIVGFHTEPGDDHIWVVCRWYWRPERLRLPDEIEWHERELFLGDEGCDDSECDVNSTAAIELTPVKVLPFPDAPLPGQVAPHTFFQRRKFDVEAQEVVEMPAAGVEPMDTDEPAEAPAAAQPRAAKPRRNEQKERLDALEKLVASLQGRMAAVEIAQGVGRE